MLIMVFLPDRRLEIVNNFCDLMPHHNLRNLDEKRDQPVTGRSRAGLASVKNRRPRDQGRLVLCPLPSVSRSIIEWEPQFRIVLRSRHVK